MKKGVLALTLILLLTLVIGAIGCSEEETGPSPSVTPTATPTATLTPSTTATVTPTSSITPTLTPTPAPSPIALFLEITQPSDGDEVSTSPINVTGKTISSAVVSASIDDTVEIADVDQNGNFSVMVTLEEGLNLIEVIASDQLGNEKSASIAVFYAP